jgi:hypothetical protein
MGAKTQQADGRAAERRSGGESAQRISGSADGRARYAGRGWSGAAAAAAARNLVDTKNTAEEDKGRMKSDEFGLWKKGEKNFGATAGGRNAPLSLSDFLGLAQTDESSSR